jgi:hypothetical protein
VTVCAHRTDDPGFFTSCVIACRPDGGTTRAAWPTSARSNGRAGSSAYVTPLSRWARWKLATDLEVDAESDRDEVDRMAARWEPA